MKEKIFHHKNQKKITIYYIKDIEINQLIDKHKELLSNNNTVKINTNILSAKYEFINHLICMRYINNKQEEIRLNTKVLQKTFKTEYITMLEVLEKLQIININPQYKIGEKSRIITLLPPFKNQIKKKQPNDLLLYNKLNNLCENTLNAGSNKRKENDIKRISEDVSHASKILDIYDKNLKLLRISHIEEINNFIESNTFHSPKQYEYYTNITNHYINDNKTFQHKSIDNNNRIYSILTSTPRLIKNFLNIKYSIDVKNSHPLLINYLLINRLNISNSLISLFYKCIDSNNKSFSNNTNTNYNTTITQLNYTFTTTNNINIDKSIKVPYGIENIRNSICINQNHKNEFARIPNDVWLYILNTSTGHFWDDFKDNFIEYGLNRTDVKQTIFHEVFYTKSTSLTARGKMFAKAFKEIYPNVYELIVTMKKERENAVYEYTFTEENAEAYLCELEEKTKHISNDMMKLESAIFFEILDKIYKRRDCKALTIHDAIIVLDTNSKKKCNSGIITNIMKKVYEKYHLHPQFSIEFNPLNWRIELERAETNEPLIAAKIKEIEEDAAKGKKIAIETLELINNNEIEIAFDDKNTPYFHRLFEHSTKPGEKGAINKKYKQIQKASKKYLKS